ncbi:MAG TPA: hypothetical protein VF618_11790 [Thermoanaerobaculia bacterium]
MRFVITGVRSKTEWSGDDSEYQQLRDELLGDDTLPIRPEPKTEESSKVSPDLLKLIAILAVT